MVTLAALLLVKKAVSELASMALLVVKFLAVPRKAMIL
jgi:hypothetical protein